MLMKTIKISFKFENEITKIISSNFRPHLVVESDGEHLQNSI